MSRARMKPATGAGEKARRLRRRVVGGGAAAVLAAFAAAATGQASGGSSSSSSYTIPMHVHEILTVLPVRGGTRARALYRRLIPRGYEVPADPRVEVYLVEPQVPSAVPGAPYDGYSHWIEGAFALRARYGSREGWFPLGMPLNSSFEYQLGRDAGLPKYMSDDSMVQSGADWTAQAAVDGRLTQRLAFTPAAGLRAPAIVTSSLARGGSPLFALNPALVGPGLEETDFDPMPGPAPLAAPQPGLVHVTIDPVMSDWDPSFPKLLARGQTLRDLIAGDQTQPGLFWDTQENLGLTTTTLAGRGGYPAPAPARAKRPHQAKRPHRTKRPRKSR